MKDTTKITLTLGQLKRLVTESKKDFIYEAKKSKKDLIAKARKIVMTSGLYDPKDPLIGYNDPECVIASFDLKDAKEGDENSGGLYPEVNYDNPTKADLLKWCELTNKYDEFNIDNMLNTPANFEKLINTYYEEIIDSYNFRNDIDDEDEEYDYICSICGKAGQLGHLRDWVNLSPGNNPKWLCPTCAAKNPNLAKESRYFDSLNEAEDDSLIEKARKNVIKSGMYKKSDPMICYFTEDSTIISFNLDDVRDEFEGGEEFENFDWDDKSIGNCKRFLKILKTIIGEENCLDNCLNTPANFEKLLKKYAEDITSEFEPDSFEITCVKCGDKKVITPKDDGFGGWHETNTDIGGDTEYVCDKCWDAGEHKKYKHDHCKDCGKPLNANSGDGWEWCEGEQICYPCLRKNHKDFMKEWGYK